MSAIKEFSASGPTPPPPLLKSSLIDFFYDSLRVCVVLLILVL